MKDRGQKSCLLMKWNTQYTVVWVGCIMLWRVQVKRAVYVYEWNETHMNEMKHTIYCSLSWMYNVMKGWMYNVMKDTGQESCLLMKWNTQYTVVWDGCIMLWRIQVKRAVYEWNETHNIL